MNSNYLKIYIGLVMLISSFAYLLSKTIFNLEPSVDFQFIWLAGDMWLSGEDPYSDKYVLSATERFSDLRVPGAWYYPPNWYPIGVTISNIPFQESMKLWRLGSMVLIFVSCAALSHSIMSLYSNEGIILFCSLTFFTSLCSATPITLSLGQTSLFLLLGISLLLVSQLNRSRFLAALAITILMLKPQIGIPLSVFLLMRRYWWPSIGVAALVTVLSAAPAIYISGIENFIHSYQGIMEKYEDHSPAHPANMTGLRTLIFVLIGYKTSILIHLLISSFAAMLIGLRVNYYRTDRSIIQFSIICISAFLVPLHFYDLSFVMLAFAFLLELPRIYRFLAGLGLLVIFRANNLEKVFDLTLSETTFAVGSWLATLALLALAVIGTYLLISTSERKASTQC